MIVFTEAVTGDSVALNVDHIVAVFVSGVGEELSGKTIITLINGSIHVSELYDDVVDKIICYKKGTV